MRGWLLIALLHASAAATAAELSAVPPEWEDRVRLRHSFETAIAAPESNALSATLTQQGGSIVEKGFIGKGFKVADFGDKNSKPLRLASKAFSPDRPLTIMLWWRLDVETPETGGYGLLWLGGKSGYLSCFVAGKGEWCALREPTWVYQFYNFPGIANDNNVWTGRAPTKPGVWRHTAVTIANTREIAWYQDGQQTSKFIAKGRELAPGELNVLELGGNHHRQPMTIDEALVLDRVLSADEIARYFKMARALSEVSAP